MHERTNISSGGFGGGGRMTPIETIAKEFLGEADGKIADGVMRDKITSHKLRERAFGLTVKRSQAESKAGEVSPASSIIKYIAAEMNKSRLE